MPAGRPLKPESAEAVQEAADKYFEQCDAEGRPYTVNGLALAVGLHRATLLNYEKKKLGRPEEQEKRRQIFDVIKNAKAKVESQLEEKLLAGKCAPAGPIFILKNMGWKDKTEVDTNLNVSLNEHLREIEQRRRAREITGETE